MIADAAMFQSIQTAAIIDISKSARLNQRFEHRPEFSGSPEILRMPLHAEAEAAARVFDRFDDTVRRACRGDEPFAEIFDGLMMAAVHVARIRILEPFTKGAVEEAAGVQPHLVRDREARLLDPMLDVRADFLGDVLDERAAARDVQDLDAAADREDRKVGLDRPPHQLDFVLVAARLRWIEGRM